MERGGSILLAAAREDSEAVMSIRDAGVGIAPEMLPPVFDLFTQAERSQGGLGGAAWPWRGGWWRCTAAGSKPATTVSGAGANSSSACPWPFGFRPKPRGRTPHGLYSSRRAAS